MTQTLDQSDGILSSTWLIIVALVMAFVTRNFYWLFAIFVISIGLIIRTLQSEKEVPLLEIKRVLSGKTFAEFSHITVKLIIINASKTVFRGEIADELPSISQIVKGTNIFLLYLPGKQTTEVSYICSFPRRGKYQIGPVHSRYHDVSELGEKITKFEQDNQVVIIPNPDPVASYMIPPSFFSSLGGPFRSKLVGDGLDFATVREYREGDSYRRINWKQSAKMRILHSNEFEIDRPTNVIIVIDLADESKLIADSSVRAALGLVDYLSHRRCKVGLITLGEYIHFIPPKTGKRHVLEISEHLTNVKSINHVSNFDLFRLRLSEVLHMASHERNEVLLFSSLNRTENALLFADLLPQLGQVIVLSPVGDDTHPSDLEEYSPKLAFAYKMLKMRRNILKHRLKKYEIEVYEWHPGMPFETSVNTWRKKR